MLPTVVMLEIVSPWEKGSTPVIQDIQEQQSYRAVEAGDDVRVIEDLGFSSLDIAQLVAAFCFHD
jgi:hypothetical protein